MTRDRTAAGRTVGRPAPAGPVDGSAGTLIDVFCRSLARHPRRPAVSDPQTSLSYLELHRRSDAVAALVRSHGVGAEDRVAVLMRRSADVIVAILGVLKAGAAYVAIDDRYPGAHRDRLLRDSGAKLILTGNEWADRLCGLPGPVVPVSEWARFEGRRLRQSPRPRDLAGLIFAAGSSGRPRAVMLEHRNLASFATSPSLPQLGAEDRIGQILSVSSSGFHHELWCTLAAGAELVVLPAIPDLVAAGFRDRLGEHGITGLTVPAMAIDHVLRDDPDAFAPLRLLVAGGDVLLPSACRAVLNSRFSGKLYNMYGPAESTTCCTIHRVTSMDARSGPVPIGTELVDTTVRLLDPQLRPVPAGECGEIFVGGPGLARGYLDRPDLTADRFRIVMVDGRPLRMYRTGDLARRRDDGRLMFIGRTDRQARIRGHRVEPGEVEQALSRHPAVRDAAVLADGDGDDRRLVAFVVPGGELSVPQLREHTARELPAFMVPAEFIMRRELPFDERGKRDRGALAEALARHRARAEAFVAPRNGSERYLAGLWEDLLGVRPVGRDDDFLDLGGDSLAASRLVHRLHQELDLQLEPATVLGTPLLRELAAEVDVARVRAGERQTST